MAINFGKKDLLDLISNDKDVKRAIVKAVQEKMGVQGHTGVVGDSDNTSLLADLERWQEEYKNLQDDYDGYKSNYNVDKLKQQTADAYNEGIEEGKKSEREEWQSKWENKKQEYEVQIGSLEEDKNNLTNSLQSRFANEAELYDEYQKDTEVRKMLKGYFSQNSFEAFIATLCQEGSVQNIWDFCNENKNDMPELLWKIFECSVRLVNLTKDVKNRYKVMDVKIGSKYDEDEHVGIGRSKTQGKINKVYLRGYAVGNKIIKKSLVDVQ